MRIAESTCTKCHGIFPRTYMHQVTITENAGTSWGVAKTLKNGTTPRGSFRVYRRNKKVWICDDCYSSEEMTLSTKIFYGWIIFLILIFILLGA